MSANVFFFIEVGNLYSRRQFLIIKKSPFNNLISIMLIFNLITFVVDHSSEVSIFIIIGNYIPIGMDFSYNIAIIYKKNIFRSIHFVTNLHHLLHLFLNIANVLNSRCIKLSRHLVTCICRNTNRGKCQDC